MKKIAIIIGASGSIGRAFVDILQKDDSFGRIYAFSRSDIEIYDDKIEPYFIDIEDEDSIRRASEKVKDQADLIIVATGILHSSRVNPEKSLKDLSFENIQKTLAINTIGPALIAKYFTPKLCKERKAVFAFLSARIGSISDNRLGGWYSYRASKSALNMIIKSMSIEVKRTLKQAIIVGLHPGTVDSNLSKPFQKGVKNLFAAEYSVEKMFKVIGKAKLQDSGKIFAYDGKQIEY